MTVIDVHTQVLDEEWLRLLRERGAARYEVGPITDEYARLQGPLHDQMGKALGPEKQAHFIEDWRMLNVVLDASELCTGRMRARKPGQAG